jgi:cytochrome c-type biogenesis protein CcsB
LKQNRFVQLLGSLRLAVALLLILGVAIAAATFIEVDLGSEGARALVYNAWWFDAVLGLLAINLLAVLIRRWPYPPSQFGFLLIHVAVIVILVGAGITRFFGFEGLMPIREGESADYIYSSQEHVGLTWQGYQTSFPVRLYRPGPQSAGHDLEVAGQKYRVNVLEYWPHYRERLVQGEGGPAALRLMVASEGSMEEIAIPAGESRWAGEIRLRFRAGQLPDSSLTAPYGVLRVRVAGQAASLPVPASPPASQELAGYRFTITEFNPDFKVGAAPDPTRPLDNPMIRVQIEDPSGRTGERILFAFHPDFAASHAGGEEAFEEVDLLYDLERGITFAGGVDTGLTARATVPLQLLDMNSGQVEQEIPAGQSFPVAGMSLYHAPESGPSFVLQEVLASAVSQGFLSEDPHDPEALRVEVRGGEGVAAQTLVRADRPAGATVEVGDRRLAVSYGRVPIHLPYSLALKDFILRTYPGSDNPVSFESLVLLNDPERGVDNRPIRIYMNHPLTYRGYKHFQSSYDSDRRGTVLSVNYDPGKWPTYIGYSMITLGFLLVLIRGLLWPSSKRPQGTRMEKLATGLVVALALAVPGVTFGQAATSTPSRSTTSAPTVTEQGRFLPDEVRDQAEVLIVQDFQGRMKPLDTLAREMVRKVTQRGRFEGWEPLDLYMDWVIEPQTWWHHPLIGVRNPELKQLLGLPPGASHVAAADLYDQEGKYRLTDAVEEAHRTPDRSRSKMQRKLLSFDERFNLFFITLGGGTLRLYPIPNDPNQAWLAGRDIQDRIESPEVSERYDRAYTDLVEGLAGHSWNQALAGIAATAFIQQENGADVVPGRTALRAELFLNSFQPFQRVILPYLLAFLVLIGAYFWSLFRRDGAFYRWRHPVYLLGNVLFWIALLVHAAGFIMRWIASGRAPLSNGYESLIFIGLMVGISGFIFEFKLRHGAAAGLASLLAAVILGVAMISTFDPAIGPLVPVLVSYWLNIHVTVITASYGFLGLAALLGALVLILHFGKSPRRPQLRQAVLRLDRLNASVVAAGLGLLAVGTLLGGVWANESWGRYWGWDPKESWSLVTVIVYAIVLHLRWIPSLNRPWTFAAASFAGLASVIMTYFGVNYFLAGLHSYAQGEAARVPAWVGIGALIMLGLIVTSWWFDQAHSWEEPSRVDAEHSPTAGPPD